MYLVISVLPIISAIPYISPHLQVDPYPFLFGSPARCALVLVYLLYNKLNTLDPLLVLCSTPPRLRTPPAFRQIAVALTTPCYVSFLQGGTQLLVAFMEKSM